MIHIRCPWCGPRGCGGVPLHRGGQDPAGPASATPEDWRDYLYLPANPCGPVTETWYHRMGCRRYFTLERDTATNESRTRGRGHPVSVLPMRMRLAAQPGEEIDRAQSFTFTWNGRTVPAFAGDTIASALAATGERVFSRSFKYHRPRGLLTASYLDPGCFVQVGDEPNVRGGAPPGRARHGRALPEHLAVAAASTSRPRPGWPRRFLGAGFYYKTFIRPQRLWPAYERVLQRFIHAGEVSPDTPRATVDKRYAHPDVLVAGGGPAGMAAAAAAAAGRGVGPAGGGGVPARRPPALGQTPPTWPPWRNCARSWPRTPGIEVLTNSVVTGRYDDNWIAVVRRGLPGGAEQLIKARAKVLVVAPGLIERPYVFAGNDVPGVMLATAARRLVNLYSVKPGRAGGRADRQRRR